jgi:hypothetical protein
VAVIVIVAVPASTGVNVNDEPDVLAVTTPASLEDAVYVSGLPSGSLKMLERSSVAGEPPTVRVWSSPGAITRGLALGAGLVVPKPDSDHPVGPSSFSAFI